MLTDAKTLDAARRCFDAYGAGRSKWPADKQALFDMVSDLDEMREFRIVAEGLDEYLDVSAAPPASDALKDRILGGFPAPQETFVSRIKELAAAIRLAPAGALAGIGALGLGLGVLTAETSAAVTPEYEAYAYLEDALTPELSVEEEGILWDAE